MSFPIYIPVFNNPTYLKNMLHQLKTLGFDDVKVVDTGSTYPPMLELLLTLPHVLHSFDHGQYIFKDPTIYDSMPSLFALTDPDLLFNRHLPSSFIIDLISLTHEYKIGKAGFALDISNREIMRQETFPLNGQQHIWEWESQFWEDLVGEINGSPVYRALIDTTFAVYNKEWFNPDDSRHAVRVAGDYTARHLPWYRGSIVPKDEREYYARTANVSYYREA